MREPNLLELTHYLFNTCRDQNNTDKKTGIVGRITCTNCLRLIADQAVTRHNNLQAERTDSRTATPHITITHTTSSLTGDDHAL